jgi:hypothetical protein
MFAGIFLHFDRHSDRRVVAGMRKHIEKRWRALDQPMFIFALILNPYEHLEHFGDKVGINIFTLNMLLIQVSHQLYCQAYPYEFQLYSCVKSWPPRQPMTNEELGELEMRKAQKEREVSVAFLQYMAGTGVFQEWEENRTVFENTHVRN